jgi:hypothetical protein
MSELAVKRVVIRLWTKKQKNKVFRSRSAVSAWVELLESFLTKSGYHCNAVWTRWPYLARKEGQWDTSSECLEEFKDALHATHTSTPISTMDISTGAYSPCPSTECRLPLVIIPLQDASATPRSSSSHGIMTDGTPLPSVKQSSPNPPNNCIVIIQNNYIAEGGTINIFSSHSNGSSEFFMYPTDQKTYLTT